MKKVLAGLLAVCMLLSGCSMVVYDKEKDKQTVVATVNGAAIYKEVIMRDVG